MSLLALLLLHVVGLSFCAVGKYVIRHRLPTPTRSAIDCDMKYVLFTEIWELGKCVNVGTGTYGLRTVNGAEDQLSLTRYRGVDRDCTGVVSSVAMVGGKSDCAQFPMKDYVYDVSQSTIPTPPLYAEASVNQYYLDNLCTELVLTTLDYDSNCDPTNDIVCDYSGAAGAFYNRNCTNHKKNPARVVLEENAQKHVELAGATKDSSVALDVLLGLGFAVLGIVCILLVIISVCCVCKGGDKGFRDM